MSGKVDILSAFAVLGPKGVRLTLRGMPNMATRPVVMSSEATLIESARAPVRPYPSSRPIRRMLSAGRYGNQRSGRCGGTARGCGPRRRGAPEVGRRARGRMVEVTAGLLVVEPMVVEVDGDADATVDVDAFPTPSENTEVNRSCDTKV